MTRQPAGTDREGLSVDVLMQREQFAVVASFEVPAGETVAILGPNGAGKSTLLAILAGLLVPDRGRIALAGRPLTDCADGRGHVVPPERRRVGLMGQDPLLFPHLTAVENVAFGPRSQGRSRAVARSTALDWLDRMGLAGLGSRRPGQLSGGQRQRVALARALAAEPLLLLLDEPLGALDAETVPEVRQVLRTHLRESRTTSILVTHDVVDAAVLAERLVVLDRGRIVDDGATNAVLTTPRSSFGATLAGLNLVPGSVVDDAPSAAVAAVRTVSGLVLSGVAANPLRRGEPAAAVFSPSAVSVFRRAPGGSPRNSWTATVGSLEPGSAAVRMRTGGDLPVAVDITPAAVAELELAPGVSVVLSVKATEVVIHQR